MMLLSQKSSANILWLYNDTSDNPPRIFSFRSTCVCLRERRSLLEAHGVIQCVWSELWIRIAGSDAMTCVLDKMGKLVN